MAGTGSAWLNKFAASGIWLSAALMDEWQVA
jgi:hypothetical protein